MNATLEQLKEAVSMLPTEERIDMARFIADSLKDELDQSILDEWLDLAEKRMADVEAGKVVGIPADEFLRSIGGPEA